MRLIRVKLSIVLGNFWQYLRIGSNFVSEYVAANSLDDCICKCSFLKAKLIE